MAMDAVEMPADGVDSSALSAALGAASAAEGVAGSSGGVQSVTQLASCFGVETEGWVPSGSYVTIHVAAEPGDDDAAVAFSGAVNGSACPASVFALHRHENRLSLLNFNVPRASGTFLDEEEVISSKEPLW